MPLLKSCVVEPGLCCSVAVLCYIACWSRSLPCGLRNPHSKQSTTGHRVESEGREWNCFSFKFSLVQAVLEHTMSLRGTKASPSPGRSALGPFQADERRGLGEGRRKPTAPLATHPVWQTLPRAFVVRPCSSAAISSSPPPLGTSFRETGTSWPCAQGLLSVWAWWFRVFECFAEQHCPLTRPRAFSFSGPSVTFLLLLCVLCDVSVLLRNGGILVSMER